MKKQKTHPVTVLIWLALSPLALVWATGFGLLYGLGMLINYVKNNLYDIIGAVIFASAIVVASILSSLFIKNPTLYTEAFGYLPLVLISFAVIVYVIIIKSKRNETRL